MANSRAARARLLVLSCVAAAGVDPHPVGSVSDRRRRLLLVRLPGRPTTFGGLPIEISAGISPALRLLAQV